LLVQFIRAVLFIDKVHFVILCD